MTRLERRLKFWQKKLNLEHWLIHLEINEDKEWGNYGEIAPIPGRCEAVLTIAAGCTAEEREWTLVHELCHLLIWPLNILADTWQQSLPQKSRATHTAQWVDATEQVVDVLARLYAVEPPVRVKAQE
jgi:hypothetical protein